MTTSVYADLSREELISRLEALELDQSQAQRKAQAQPVASSSSTAIASTSNSTSQPPSRPPKVYATIKKPKAAKTFDYDTHPTRHVALLLTYHGWPYSGLAIQSDPRLVTVESELLKALEKTHLIDPAKGFEGCEYGRCGRTDRGVSGEGQVVNLYVRSRVKGGLGWRDAVTPRSVVEKPGSTDDGAEGAEGAKGAGSNDTTLKSKVKVKKQPNASNTEVEYEYPYPRLLNGVLPSSIRIVAWSPVSPDFNSRFGCTYRHYKYPFHLSDTLPLDLARMRQGAESLVGEHDFRNFCKLDGSKQILNHSRRVVKAYIDEEEVETEAGLKGLVVFNLIGTAFLWHQVRHIIGALFLIGRGLEDVGLIKELLDTEKNPSRPSYYMGDPLPLTLHECGYPEPIDWRMGPYDGPLLTLPPSELTPSIKAKAMEGRDKLEKELVALKEETELKLYQVGGGLRTLRKVFPTPEERKEDEKLASYQVGGGDVIITGKYKPVMERPRGETPDVVNRKWREAKERQGRVFPPAPAPAPSSS